MVLIPVRDAWGRPTDFRYEWVNDPAAAWIGLPTGLVLGRTLKEVFSPDELAPILPPLLTVCETGAPWTAPEHTAVDEARRVSIRADMAEDDRIHMTFHRIGLPESCGDGDVTPEVEAVRRLAAAVGTDLSKDEVLGLLADLLRELYGAGSTAIGRLDDRGRTRVLSTALDRVDTLRPGCLPLAVALETGRTVRADDITRHDDPAARQMVARGLVSALAAPILVGGVPWGALAIATPHPPPPGAESTLEAMATLIGLLLRDVDRRMADPVRQGTDRLTGLPDHAAFRDRLAESWQAASEQGTPLALAVFDVDHLAEINAHHGHATGDAVLAAVGDALRREAGDDPVARIGGEQFAWLMPGAQAHEAVARAGGVRRAVASEPFPQAGFVTVSGGVAEMSQAARPAELLRLAEGALSWTKTHGRDNVLPYDPDVVEAFSAADWAARLERDRTLASIESLARVVDAKDSTTYEHSERVAEAAALVARELGWPEDRVEALRVVGRVHDVGKIAVPDDILAKPARLSPQELRRMRGHPIEGAAIVAGVLTDDQMQWIRHHHEHWDGGGYPWGLAGEEIPEGARILALVDAFDAMLTARPYAAPRSLEDALEECRRCAGTQFWPAAVDALVRAYAPSPSSA